MGKKKLLFLMLLIVLCFSGSVYAYEKYNFKIDYTDKVNKGASEEEKIWQALRDWGFSEEATAGIMGNVTCESSFDPTVIQGHKDWSFVTGGSWAGLGICQWSGPHEGGADAVGDPNVDKRRHHLFKIGEEFDGWVDIRSNLKMLKYELLEGGVSNNWYSCGGAFSSKEEFMKSTDVNKCARTFYSGFEMDCSKDVCDGDGGNIKWEYFHNPKGENKSRADYAADLYKKHTGKTYTSPDLNGGSKTATDDKSKKETENSDSKAPTSKLIPEEWDLFGMPEKSHLKDDQQYVDTPSSIEDIQQRMSLEAVKERGKVGIVDTVVYVVRIIIASLGIFLLMYIVLIILAWLFDRTNTIFDYNLLELITFGKVRPTKEDLERGEVISTTKLVMLCSLIFIVASLLITGGVYNIAQRILNAITSIVG